MNKSIVVLTGAGISQESGIETFRDQAGLWSKVRYEDVASGEAIQRDRPRVNAFFNERRRQVHDPRVQPNAAHRALAELESKWPGDVLVVTQNVDDLHERAGSRNVMHIHGSILKAWCLHCTAVSPWREDIIPDSICPACQHPGELRPHVVLFQETPLELPFIQWAVERCGLFISIGTSGSVYPAAGLVQLARQQAAHTVELNLERSEVATEFEEHRHGRATEVVPEYVECLLAQGHW